MIINSLLDTDLYTFTVGRAVLERFPNTNVCYKFTNRSIEKTFSEECFGAIKDEILNLGNLSLTNDELKWMTTNLPFLSEEYLSWVKNMKLDPGKEVDISLNGKGELEIYINGDWSKTIFYEVPILAIISECYYKFMDCNWNYLGQKELHEYKANILSNNGSIFADFGTRRRRSFESQRLVVETMSKYKGFVGTSNVYLAKKYNLKAVGTQSHQWIMGISSLRGLRHANHHSMYNWVKVFDADLGIALTDTYGTEAFLSDFDLKFAKTYDGVRHDSGDPIKFAKKIIEHYKKLGIDPTTKTIIFSDSLNSLKASAITNFCKGKIRCSFGIGTNFSNDYKDSEPLSIVIKLYKCDGVPVVKLSDDPVKATGDFEAVQVAKWTFLDQPLY